MSIAKAFLTAFSFSIFLKLYFSSSAISQTLFAAARIKTSRSGVRAKIVPFPGNAIPIASIRVFMLFAVNIPLQLPPLGHALHSMSVSWASLMSPFSNLPTASNAVARSIGSPSLV